MARQLLPLQGVQLQYIYSIYNIYFVFDRNHISMCYFSIQVCSTQVGGNGKSFIIPNDKDIFCVSCFEDKIATKCVKCKHVLTSGGVTFRGEPWHKVAISTEDILYWR